MKELKGIKTGLERAFYGEKDLYLLDSSIDGIEDGESAFKECNNIIVENCYFNLRYPFWHVHGLKIISSEMTDKCRASLWYSDHIEISSTKMHGVKAVRECHDVVIKDSDIISPEFGWSSFNVRIIDSKIEAEYFFLRGGNLHFNNVEFKGKYSFQYINDSEFNNCRFDTKDAFWHSENVIVRDSYIKGEYLAWYSKNLTLVNCVIEGTQPFCYCKNLTLINCKMVKCDLSFERSSVHARVLSHIDSVKNPLSGKIEAISIGEIIKDIPGVNAEISLIKE